MTPAVIASIIKKSLRESNALMEQGLEPAVAAAKFIHEMAELVVAIESLPDPEQETEESL